MVGSVNACILKQSAKWPFKVIQGTNPFGTNRKRVRNFLFVINSNIASFHTYYRFSVENIDPSPIPPKFWGCSPWTIYIADVVAPRNVDAKPIIRVIIVSN